MFCIPAPVIGGIIVSVIVCILHVTNVADITFDKTLREICIVFFFTSVGFQADVRLLKTGGMKLLITTLLIAVMVICQNGLAVGLAKAFGLPTSLGMCTGSISMTGGHGTSAAFQIALAAGAGTLISDLISKTGITVPGYLGAIVVAALFGYGHDLAETLGTV